VPAETAHTYFGKVMAYFANASSRNVANVVAGRSHLQRSLSTGLDRQ